MEHRQHNQTWDITHLADQIHDRLANSGIPWGWNGLSRNGHPKGSAVMFLITPHQADHHRAPEPCLLLNKRSAKVLQPGDLCCPGGGVARFDKLLSLMLHWPQSPLQKWPQWKKWRNRHPERASELATLLATGLREGWEEMRLNPLRVQLLGPLPVQQLIMFERHIFPLAGWIAKPSKWVPNWEVERIVHIPLRKLMDPRHYGRYRLTYQTRSGVTKRRDEFPCFIHEETQGREVLWGATFRITMDFLKMVFGFELPDLAKAPVIEKKLGETYLNGSRIQESTAGHIEQDDDF